MLHIWGSGDGQTGEHQTGEVDGCLADSRAEREALRGKLEPSLRSNVA